MVNTGFLCAPGFSLAWWVGMVLKCTGALKDNKDFLVGRTGLDSSTIYSAIFNSYFLKI